MVEKAITKKEVAKALNLDRTTVSKVLNDTPNTRISESTRNRVLKAAKRLGYTPHELPGSYKNRFLDNLVGILGLNSGKGFAGDEFFGRAIRAIQLAAQKDSYAPIFFDQGVHDLEKFITKENIKGLLLWQVYNRDVLEVLQTVNIPSVLVGQDANGKDCISVQVNNFQGSAKAIEYLSSLGHKKIAFIASQRGSFKHPDFLDRLRGYKYAIERANIGLDPNFIIWEELPSGCQENHPAFACGYKILQKLIADNRLPTAIFAVNDYLALGAMKALTENALGVPEDVSIIGFDNIEWASHTMPPLTTLDGQIEQVCSVAVEKLDVLLKKGGDGLCSTVLEPKLITRGSTEKNQKLD